MKILHIGCVDRTRRVVDIRIQHGSEHRIGHLPSEGWWCSCSRAKRCPHIDSVKALVPPMEQL